MRATPRVSVLIPNFNNGVQSSVGGRIDLLGDLLASLRQTLEHDPTPLEILAHDDGSTDDSLDTLRRAAKKTWRGGEPFLTLVETEHCGILSRVSNQLVTRAQGDILVRLDGDIVVHTANWADAICKSFDKLPQNVGVLGPMQLSAQGHIHAFGDFVLHPKGYTHVGAGLPPDAIRMPIEVDHVMGCFYCFRRAVFDDVGGFDERFLRGQTVDFGMSARLKGWRAIAIPQVRFTHRHGDRESRKTTADTTEGMIDHLGVFRDKWGFCRVAPDLDVVRAKFAGTPLLWNPRVWACESIAAAEEAAQPATDDPLELFNASEWGRYLGNPAEQQRLAWTAGAVATAAKANSRDDDPAVLLDAGSGLMAHLLATKRIACTAAVRPGRAMAVATHAFRGRKYPGKPPQIVGFDPATNRADLPDGRASFVCLVNVIERHPNPVAVLREARRLVRDDGRVVIVTAAPEPQSPALTDADHRYQPVELAAQLQFGADLSILNDPRPRAAGQPMVALARPKHVHVPTASSARPSPPAAVAAA